MSAVQQTIQSRLFALQDLKYQAFQSKLIPTICPDTVIGVRMPALRKLAKELSGTPSLVLRCLGKQECAWDLAKRYNTTIAAILSANQLESEEELGRDQLLLIPRKRA